MLVIEKLSATGGTSALSGGGIAAPGSVLQKEAGIEDSPEAYVEQWMYYQSLTHREGMENPDEERCLFLARQGADLIDWLMSYGYEFGTPTSFGLIEGVDRFHYPSNLENGQTGKMTEIAQDLGAEILLETRLPPCSPMRAARSPALPWSTTARATTSLPTRSSWPPAATPGTTSWWSGCVPRT